MLNKTRLNILFGFILSVFIFSGKHCVYAQEKTVPESADLMQLSFAPIAKKAMPAVVNIYTQRLVKSRDAGIFADPLFRQFFGPDMGFSAPRDRIERSLGSGVIISDDGYVITCNHVIQGSDLINIVLPDKREFQGKVVRTDEKADLALVKIEAGKTKLPFIELGTSEQTEVGDLVIAIGNPFGLGQTVTSGIVSALNRNVAGASDYQYFIQTDAAINLGNSGGALVDMKGHLLGVNSAIYSKTGGSNGVGFAIPADIIRVMHQKAMGKVGRGRPWIGIQATEVTQVIAEALKQPARGIVINRIHPESPAQKAGLKVGDILLKLDNRELNDIGALDFALSTKTVGSVSQLVIRRGKTIKNINFPIQTLVDRSRRVKITGNNPLSGTVVVKYNLSLAVERGLDIFDQKEGIVITKIDRDSMPDRLGFVEDDVILKINDKEMKAIDDLTDLLKTESRQWHVQFKRKNETLSLLIRA